jgi:hypothetical protein
MMLPLQGHARSTCRSPDANARCPPVCDGPLTSAEWLSPTQLGHSGFAVGTALPVKGFGCRPVVTYPRVLGPASESLQGRNPRWAARAVAVYGDLTAGRRGRVMR